MTSVELVNGGVAGRSPVTLEAEMIDSKWLITSFEYDDSIRTQIKNSVLFLTCRPAGRAMR